MTDTLNRVTKALADAAWPIGTSGGFVAICKNQAEVLAKVAIEAIGAPVTQGEIPYDEATICWVFKGQIFNTPSIADLYTELEIRGGPKRESLEENQILRAYILKTLPFGGALATYFNGITGEYIINNILKAGAVKEIEDGNAS